MERPIAPDGRMGKYRILNELGRGGMGIVYLAFDPDLKRKVALKVLQNDLAADTDFVRRFEEEACSVANLFHPNILPVNSLSWQDERLVIEMPYIETGSLADVIAQRGLYCPDAVRYCADILDALAACHAHGIVHRDVKPSNILIDMHGRALLSDFGLAKALGTHAAVRTEGATAMSVFVGTPRYAPLEAWDGAASSSAWDLYSVGVILYEGLSGTRLIESDTFLGYVRAMESGDFPKLMEIRQGISEAMSALVADLLVSSAASRPTDAEEVLRRLRATPEYERFRESLEVTGARPAGRPKRPRALRSRHRRRLYLSVAFGVMALILAAGAFLLVFKGDLHRPALAPPDNPSAVATGTPTEEGVPGLAGLLRQPRFTPPDRGLAFTALVAGTPERQEQFVLVEGADPGTSKGLLFSAMRICDLSFDKQDAGTLGIAGTWGAFTDASALECVRGEVSGTGRWLVNESTLWMTLVFTARDEALHWEEHVTLVRSEETDTAVLWQAEESDYLAPMLFTELAVRVAGWANVVDLWLPALPDAHLVLQDGRKGVGASETDALWKKATAVAVPAFPRELGAKLSGLLRDDGVVLRLWAPESPPVGWSLRLGLQTGFSVPQRHSKRYEAAYTDGAWAGGKAFEHGHEVSWQPAWQLAALNDTDGWSAELTIDAGGIPAPSSSAPWRLNVIVLAAANDSTEQSVLFWGAPEVSQTHHGVMLFGPEP